MAAISAYFGFNTRIPLVDIPSRVLKNTDPRQDLHRKEEDGGRERAFSS